MKAEPPWRCISLGDKAEVPTSDAHVRDAIALALDRDSYVGSVGCTMRSALTLTTKTMAHGAEHRP
jgi:ABC-type oligopeptide transport system substrate-binding subunit